LDLLPDPLRYKNICPSAAYLIDIGTRISHHKHFLVLYEIIFQNLQKSAIA
jgi:hypothetical protein